MLGCTLQEDPQPANAVTYGNLRLCTWVIRGHDWIWGDQDGRQAGRLVGKPYKGWHRVKWSTGITAAYRIGAEDCFDLEVGWGLC